MSFYQNLVSIFLAVLLGFIFSIILFYLTNKWNRKAQKKSLEKNLIKEFEFNEKYLQGIVKKLSEAIEDITIENRSKYYYFSYKSYQRLFTIVYFKQEFVYEKLDPNDTYRLDLILNRMTLGGEQFMNDLMQKWKENRINQQQALGFTRLERNSIEQFIKDIGKIKQKIIK